MIRFSIIHSIEYYLILYLHSRGAGDDHVVQALYSGRSDVQCVLELLHHHLAGHLKMRSERSDDIGYRGDKMFKTF